MLNKHVGAVSALVSEEDADVSLTRWHLGGGKTKPGQAGRYLQAADGRYLHRLVAHRMGLIPEVRGGGQRGQWTRSVDHINGNKLDNRRENLRLRNRRQQMTNLNDSLRSNNKSGFRGVCYIAKQGGAKKWHASATVHYKAISIGYYLTREEAIAARQGWDIAQAVLM